MRPLRCLTCVAAALTVAGGLAACGGSGSTGTGSTGTGASDASGVVASALAFQQRLVSVIAKVSPSVVQISTPEGLGSGVVYDSKGDIVTNAHVVAAGGPLKVTDSHGRTYDASLVGSFTGDDLAVVRAAHAGLPAASFADSGRLQVGDVVLAIGNPLGLRSSVTDGIVSALGREVSESDEVVLPDVIQTSAPINPGNSGGALVDLQGQVVGIPTLAATDPQLGGGAAPGIGFAIPSSLVSDIAGQIVRYGHVVKSHRAYLGVSLATGPISGAVVTAVQGGGPAARAGIVAGDVITSIAGHRVASPTEVSEVMATLTPGSTVPVALLRQDGSTASVEVKLGEFPGTGG